MPLDTCNIRHISVTTSSSKGISAVVLPSPKHQPLTWVFVDSPGAQGKEWGSASPLGSPGPGGFLWVIPWTLEWCLTEDFLGWLSSVVVVCRASTTRAERRTQEGPKRKLERLLKAVDRIYCSGKSYAEFFGLHYCRKIPQTDSFLKEKVLPLDSAHSIHFPSLSFFLFQQ